jgi:hypothetical protein
MRGGRKEVTKEGDTRRYERGQPRRKGRNNVKGPRSFSGGRPHHQSGMAGGKWIYRRFVPARSLFNSMASAAASLRSTCGSERRPPECSKQRWPGATPHAEQGTEDNCSGVRSRSLIQIGCMQASCNTVQNGTVRGLILGNCRSYCLAGGTGLPRSNGTKSGAVSGGPGRRASRGSGRSRCLRAE